MWARERVSAVGERVIGRGGGGGGRVVGVLGRGEGKTG